MIAFAAAGLVAVVLAAVGAVVLVRRDDTPSHPAEWDPRLAELVRFVEHQKADRFKHPVRAVLLDDDEFEQRLTVDEESLSDEERDAADLDEVELRALGLFVGPESLLDEGNTVRRDSVAAFYDNDKEEIVIPADGFGSLVSQATLVHELTHALQDQLGQLARPDDIEGAQAVTALIEGDAQRVSAAWVDSLDADERTQLDEELAAQSEEGDDSVQDANPALVALATSMYPLGEAMVTVLDDVGKLDAAFEDPPNSFADVIEPQRWQAPFEVVPVDPPVLEDGEEELGDPEPLGAHELYLMLATTLDPADALDIVGGWGGDRISFFRAADGAGCLRIAVVGVDDDATEKIGTALEKWADSRPEGAASYSVVGGRPQLDACDRGSAEARLSEEGASLPALRAEGITELVRSGFEVDDAICFASEIVDHLPFELLTNPDPSVTEMEQIENVSLDAQRICMP